MNHLDGDGARGRRERGNGGVHEKLGDHPGTGDRVLDEDPRPSHCLRRSQYPKTSGVGGQRKSIPAEAGAPRAHVLKRVRLQSFETKLLAPKRTVHERVSGERTTGGNVPAIQGTTPRWREF